MRISIRCRSKRPRKWRKISRKICATRDTPSPAEHRRCPKLLTLRRLKPGEVRRAMERGAGLRVGLEHWVCHAEDRSHHRFGFFVPEVAMIFDNAGIDFHVPVRHVHATDPLNLPKIQ